MKKNEIKELHQKTVAQLQAMLEPLQKELALARLQKAAGKLEDTALVRRVADDIARVKTIITIKRKQEQEDSLKSKDKETKETK
ncbi:MAG: 50S ribosomal protein L29 [Candidatus Pacebacteria bacterium]|nr:50S ribosomal protein L29 [Candidatus Paceibacterota bacterium]